MWRKLDTIAIATLALCLLALATMTAADAQTTRCEYQRDFSGRVTGWTCR